jgi:PAS domain S-box-containing protein
MRPGRETPPITSSIRAKLLVMLAVLSLPLLIISLYQLNNYRSNFKEHTANITHIKARTTASTLALWLENHKERDLKSEGNIYQNRLSLYNYLKKQIGFDSDTALVIFDAQGQPISSSNLSISTSDLSKLSSSPSPHRWIDETVRITSLERIDPYNWYVVIGTVPAEVGMARRSLLILTGTWAFALTSSILMAIWAVGRFTKPLRELASSASILGEGELNERAKVETEDEVGILAKNFNLMATRLQTKFDELRAQGAFIEEVLDSLPIGVAVLDSNLNLRKVNTTFAGFINKEVSNLTGSGLYEAANGLTVLSEIIEDVRKDRKPFVHYSLSLELSLRERENNEVERCWDIILWPIAARSTDSDDMILIISEVSKRVHAEKLATAAFAAERARAAELESVINQMKEGVIIIDRKGRYRVNPAAAQILGKRPNEFRDGVLSLEEDIKLFNLKEEEIPPQERPLRRAFERQESVSGEQLKIRRGDGELRVLAISATPLLGEGQKHEGIVAVFRDITEEVEQHNELVAAYDRLREHDRLKSAFVANISHELRTPLNVIIGMCQLLGRDKRVPLTPLQNEAVARMERNARSLLELVNDLLHYSKLEAGRSALHIETVSVIEIVDTVVQNYTNEAKRKDLELRIEVSRDVGHVLTDRNKFLHILSSLVSNAIKFTSAGMVKIRVEPVNNERWSIEVSDTGIGISEEALSYIFDEFRQVDDQLTRVYGGIGLGLAITRKLVQLLDGEIQVSSKVNEGSQFRIIFPYIVQHRTGTGSLIGTVPEEIIKRQMRAAT